MKEEENNLEEKSKELLNLRDVTGNEIYLSNIKPLEDYILSINYLIKKHYIIEVGSTVKDFHYELTSKGKQWIENNN